MNDALSEPLKRLHQLAWQAGAWMDEGWWQSLSLADWQKSYQQYPRTRPQLDRLIAARRGFPQSALPSTLTPEQLKLLKLEDRLPGLCTALGLLAISCPDYLMIGHYRRVLSDILGSRGCDQLLALGEFSSPRPASLSPETLVEQAQETGTAWWRSASEHCEVCNAMQIILPPGVSEVVPTLGSPIPWLLRIGRFI
ncbi:hypothetical protein LLS47_02265 [Rouxiella badensis]|uniref:type III secretion system domain-containing protein n=1 Tax=Rouxiella badensis TaxID=1646377 RepID=UPI00178861D4|nr:type III secretion system domain-containing protein [Rouxiella badensis]MCC3703340.1 hypothetical protein [Rouxiella badensis]MCC3731763.1 hypothetical protein [Rouxiella badensis]MCC3757152.1 hypothetical protein [Rouxiella badensis]QOI55306.1 hypothetical protein H2866_20735 [Rouxiella badensis subsp. acadiensis]